MDAIEAEAIAALPDMPTGGSHPPATLGKILFFDKALSVNQNEACAFCHMPATGFQGAIEELNRNGIAQPGSVRTRFSMRKPLSAAYAAFSPPLLYADKPGQAKCVHCFIGGNFWDLRATGLRLQSATALQAEGSPLNPTEMANPDPACIVRRMSKRPYKALFERTWGPLAFDVAWPANTETLCRQPNNTPASAIGSETPDSKTMPYVVDLDPRSRARVQAVGARPPSAFRAAPSAAAVVQTTPASGPCSRADARRP